MQKNMQKQNLNLVLAALFVAISICLSLFTRIYISFLGYPSVRFSLSEIPLFLAGAFIGPIYGAMAGFVSDIICFIVAPAGPYHFGFTLNSILIGFIPGVIFYLIRNEKIRVPFATLNKVLSIMALIGALVYINFIGIDELEEITKIGPFSVNVVLSGIMVVLVGGLFFIISKLKKLYSGNKGLFSIDQVIFVMCINYIIINLFLTPIWMLQMYNIPIGASVMVRIFKSLLDIPLQASVIYIVIHAIPVRMRERLV